METATFSFTSLKNIGFLEDEESTDSDKGSLRCWGKGGVVQSFKTSEMENPRMEDGKDVGEPKQREEEEEEGWQEVLQEVWVSEEDETNSRSDGCADW